MAVWDDFGHRLSVMRIQGTRYRVGGPGSEEVLADSVQELRDVAKSRPYPVG